MTAGSKTAEQKVTVALDPEEKIAAEALALQWRTLTTLAGLMSKTADMEREAARHADDPQWAKFRDALAAARLAPQLQSLYTLVDAGNDAPTEAMTNLLDQLQADYDRAAKEFAAQK